MSQIIYVGAERWEVNSNAWVTQIVDSYRCKKLKDMRALLGALRRELPDTDAVNRLKTAQMLNEWRTHNLFYALHLYRDRTRSVDLNDNPWYLRLAYAAGSLMYWRI